VSQPSSLYWRKTSRLTAWLLLVWVVLTFGVTWFARELNEYSFFGFPFGFYFAAQGILLCYLGIIVHYSRRMRDLDAEHETDNEPE
jgi:putative solute:sodium symporter small subunit